MSNMDVHESPATLRPKMRAIDVLVEQLESEGVTHLFGIPGGNLVPLYESLRSRGRIRPVICKHEEGGAFMADGFARVSRTLGVCCGIAGPGALHAVNAMANAYADSVPVLLLSGQVSTSVFGRGAAQDSSSYGLGLVDVFRPLTKDSAMLHHAESMQRVVQHAIRSAMTGRQGPVHLNLPCDLANVRIPAGSLGKSSVPAGHTVDLAETAHAAALLAKARRPAILAGTGVHRAGAFEALRRLVERTGIPVATTPKAKGAFPENHPLSLGVYGFGGHQRATQYLTGEADVLLVVGSSLGEMATNAWDKRLAEEATLIQVDVDPMEIGKNFPVEVGIVADAGAALAALEAQLTKVRPERPGTLPAHLLEIPRYLDAARMDDESAPLKPQRVVAAIRRALPDDGMVFCDIGNVMSWLPHYFEIRQPGTFFLNLGLGTMGWAIPAAIGGQFAAPERTVVAVLGDGAFTMSGMEVHTAVEHNLPVVFVVLNDGGYGMVEHGETLIGGRAVSPSRFHQRIDAAGLARSLGARGLAIENPAELDAALADAIRARVPTVLDVRIDPDEIPASLRVRTESLQKMFAAAKEAARQA